MYKLYVKKCLLGICCLLITQLSFAQTKVSGTITDATTKEPLIGVSVQVKGKVVGTITNTKGEFSFSVSTPPPFTLLISSVGYESQEMAVSGNSASINVALKEQAVLGQEVVVSASRVEESVMKSSVSIEKMDIRAIRETPSANFFDAIKNIKGVEMSTQSLTFSNPNTRGFSGNGNVRMVQLVDGMDNQAPGLNFSVANIAGLSELDVESVELLPGASSALYGPNAMNGILLMNSKSPFLYQGLSAYAKSGIMSADNRTERYNNTAQTNTPFYDFGVRYAKAFNNKLAFKANLTYLKANDWQATDYRDQSLVNGSNFSGTRSTNLGYDGVNVYGDASTGLNSTLLSALPAVPAFKPINDGINQIAGLIGPAAGLSQSQAYTKILNDLYPKDIIFGRQGYRERDLVDYNATSLKANASLHYRINDNVEAILQGNWGKGTTVYTGADRYYIDNFTLGQYKAEVKGSNFFVRAYTTQERSGDAYAVGIAGNGMNKIWTVQNGRVVIDPTYFATFAGTYAGATFPAFATALQQGIAGGKNPLVAYQDAVNAIRANQATTLQAIAQRVGQGQAFAPGSAEFAAQLNAVTGKAIPGDAASGGAKFLDKTNLYHFEGMYNFNKLIDPKKLEIIAGANYRVYDLNSGGTIFINTINADKSEPSISEYGGYVQAQKGFGDIFKLTGSVRYDKNENFKGQFSPRISGVLTLAKNHNFRGSFQTGFRLPTTQNQFIDLLTPQVRLIGALQPLRDKYFSTPGVPVLDYAEFLKGKQTPFAFSEFKPERVVSAEFGYKGLIAKKLFVDAYYYNSVYKDYIGGSTILVPAGPNAGAYSMSTNYTKDIKSQGFGIGLDYSLPKNFNLGINMSNNTLNAGGVKMFDSQRNRNTLDDGFQVGFNTPKNRYNISFGNRNIGKSGFGFNITYRTQDSFEWNSSIGSNALNNSTNPDIRPVIPVISTLDAQISKKLSSIKSIIKIGGTNLGGSLYTTGWGNPSVGSMYYVAITFDELLNK